MNFERFKTKQVKVLSNICCILLIAWLIYFIYSIYQSDLEEKLFQKPIIHACKECVKICEDEFFKSDLCKDFIRNQNSSSVEFKFEGEYIYRSARVNDGSIIKYDSETGNVIETCGFWIGVMTQKKPPCATPEELEEARKNM